MGYGSTQQQNGPFYFILAMTTILTPKELILKYNVPKSNTFEDSVRVVVTDKRYGIIFGEDNYFSAGCTLFTATGYRENTLIGSNNYFGPSTVIKNDVLIGNNNTFDSSSYIGNLSTILNYIKIESNSNICDLTTIGSYAHIGCLSPIIKDVKPFSKVYGNPALLKGNVSSKDIKNKFSNEQLKQIALYVKEEQIPEDVTLITLVDDFSNFSRKKYYL
jgi:acyl-[acyl carrier protein]--UDP-N-acetylglucosamine O-acyltransferase